MSSEAVRQKLLDTLRAQGGILFGHRELVGRDFYTGRDIIAKNSRFEPGYTDERGYVPVEWWIMSLVEAANPIKKPNEGITEIALSDGSRVLFTEAAALAEKELFGKYRKQWPLTKVFDPGGSPVTPSFGGEPEVPPVPFHAHPGEVIDGKVYPPGKLEAYFFPPTDIPPYNVDLGRVISRLGLKPGTTKEQVLAAMKQFGKSDDMYALGNVFEIKPYEGWTIPAGILHAPGPWPTFEIQLPQDDNNFVSWHLGVVLDDAERERLWKTMGLRGLRDAEDVLEQAVDWEASVDPNFKENHHRLPQVLESGPWGRRLRIFFDEFYGEAIEVEPGHSYTRAADERPWAGIVWSGQGTLGGATITATPAASGKEWQEFLVTPGHEARFTATGDLTLRVYTVFPFELK